VRTLLLALILLLASAPGAAAHGVGGVITHRDTRDELALVDVAATAAAADAPDALPYQWCGDPRTSDDSAHAALPASSPRFKLVYAHPADRPDRFAAWRDALQANVALVQRFMAAQSGGAKALRIDMGTRCGPRYVDLQVVHLTGPRANYVDDFGRGAGALASGRHGAAGGDRRPAARDRRLLVRRRLAQRAAELQVPLAAQARRAVAEHRRRHQGRLCTDQGRPRAAPAGAGRGDESRRERFRRLAAQRPRGRRDDRPRADALQPPLPG
jgi:hypothetical protein